MLKRRSCVDPNEGFLKQLKDFDESGRVFNHLNKAEEDDANVPILIMRRRSLE